jgi:hypothetical protein
MRKAIALFLVLTLAVGAAFATDSRIESMGKSDRYMLDEMAMFTNPAYFLMYPNVLTGSLGKYNSEEWPYSLSEQWFGGWLTVNKFAFGGAVNRHDGLENFLVARRNLRYKEVFPSPRYVVWDTSWNLDTTADTTDAKFLHYGGRRFIKDTLRSVIVETVLPMPVGETDLFLGYNLGNMSVGGHLFVVQQDSMSQGVRRAASGIVKGDLGFLMKLREKDLVDVALSLARITYFSEIALRDIQDLDVARLSLAANVRAYLTVAPLGGQVVPSFKFSQIAIANDTTLTVSPGVGYQREIEGGLFWAGLDYTFDKDRDTEGDLQDTTITHTTAFSFGIEKQVAWPWFTLRVGGRKSISKMEMRDTSGVTVKKGTNSDNNRSLEDLVAAGVSLKVQDRLRFDVSANERLPFSNLFNGNLENIATRISATYSF